MKLFISQLTHSDIFTTEEMTLETGGSSISHENLLQYILGKNINYLILRISSFSGGVVGGLLILTLLIFITMKVIIPKLCPRNPTATRVIQNLGGTVVINGKSIGPVLKTQPDFQSEIQTCPEWPISHQNTVTSKTTQKMILFLPEPIEPERRIQTLLFLIQLL